MTEFRDAPVFGERVSGVAYVRRPSAYAIIRNAAGEVAVVRTPKGAFLPGGGIEAGETPEEAVVREVLEECGFAIRLLSRLQDAVQFVHAPAEARHFEKCSAFFEAVVAGSQTSAVESGHEVLWLAQDAARRLLSHESHSWAVQSST